jgi:hypothetical protein
LIRGGNRFASRKRVKSKNLEPHFDSIEAERVLAGHDFIVMTGTKPGHDGALQADKKIPAAGSGREVVVTIFSCCY